MKYLVVVDDSVIRSRPRLLCHFPSIASHWSHDKLTRSDMRPFIECRQGCSTMMAALLKSFVQGFEQLEEPTFDEPTGSEQ